MGDVLSGQHQMRGGSGSVCAPRHRSWLSALHGDTSVRLWSWLSGLTQSGLVHLSLRIFSPPRCSCFLLYNASLFAASGPLHLPYPSARMTLAPLSICSNTTHPSVLGTDSVSSGRLPVPCLCYSGPSSSPPLSYQFFSLSLLEADFNFHKTVLFYLLEEDYGGATRNFPVTTFS